MKEIILSLFMVTGFAISHAAEKPEAPADPAASKTITAEVVTVNPLRSQAGGDAKEADDKKESAAAPTETVPAAGEKKKSKKEGSGGCALL